MSRLGDIVPKVRSKNAGPFWLTIDIFCGTPEMFRRVSEGLKTEAVVKLLQADATLLKRFDIDSLNVVKFSIPRPQIQGTRLDRDMHGASFAALVAEMEI
ncbi:DUF4387 family protein [Aliiruegeria lutimaris]|uniref:DUF4387 domain-containing protein n=1 Tax=Aliiruegeria lutimaris TaxID=571298 RepID=A0A1G9AN41_9RHOB|nr:DUF4387 family protein [Aliiruegeria lutimaris]SDK28244.1 protein of unknown function [Aliiruegeria lutimaris]